ncbi:hypothetical protein HU200_023886 [Digitaria exilis]|uniref:DUF7811 domain-containing protein n=1 Tax=Digitaria exilis TaxID=1010633 RepID=A0A835BZH0_9POAL|nr:hypothetical protein HU200_023886 [Digitaria exilis]
MADSAALSSSSSSLLPRSLASRRPLSSPHHARGPRPLHRGRSGSRSLHRLRARAGKDDPEDLYGPYPWDQPLDLTTGFGKLACYLLIAAQMLALRWLSKTQKLSMIDAAVAKYLHFVEKLTILANELVILHISVCLSLLLSVCTFPTPYKGAQFVYVLADIQWVPEDRVTLFTSDGLVQIGGSLVPRRVSSSELKRILISQGLDMGRRLCIFGFCRSIEMLSDVVEDTVLEHGGEVVTAEKASNDGLQEKLIMSVAVPLLWGVPPASETLHVAVRSGGGIVDKIYWQWDLF